MGITDYRSWNFKPPKASAEARAKLTQTREPHRGFKPQLVATPKRKRAKYSEGFLVTLVALRFGSIKCVDFPRLVLIKVNYHL